MRRATRSHNVAVDAAALRSINSLKRALKRLPITAVARIASRAAPAMTDLAGSAFRAGQTVYGRARPLSVEGERLDLERTGVLKRALEFRATGRDIRTLPLPRYARYMIAAYAVLPPGKAPLPQAWKDKLAALAAEVLHAEITGRTP
jgi:hypothetical protein